MLPLLKSYKPEIISLRELTDLYFDYYHISFLTFTAIEKCDRFGKKIFTSFVPRLEGRLCEKAWKELPVHFQHCLVGDHKIKPYEFQAFLIIDKFHSEELAAKYVPKILASFKSRSTKLLNQYMGTHGKAFWENSYSENVIAGLDELEEALETIDKL